MVSGVYTLLGILALVLLTAAGLRFYLPLARWTLVQGGGNVPDGWVRRIDGVAATVLVVWFAMMGRDALLDEGARAVEFRHILTGAAVYGSIVLFLAGSFFYRDLPLSRVFGWNRSGFGSALGRGVLYLVAAYPLLMLVQAMVLGAAGGDIRPQEVVEFLIAAESPRDRIAVLVMAVAVAPVAEEIIFRGFLYPVGKRYAGPFVSAAGTGLLFALLHGHMASIPALFALALCLVLAYEKSGSLLVPMVMHAVFNAVSVTAILWFL